MRSGERHIGIEDLNPLCAVDRWSQYVKYFQHLIDVYILLKHQRRCMRYKNCQGGFFFN